MHKLMYIIGLCLLVSSSLFAQDKTKAASLQPVTVKGLVVNAKTGEPIPGAHVYIKETMRGNMSDANGEFALFSVVKGQTICISCVGCKSILIAYKDQEFIKAELVEDVVALSKVITVGYGVQERRDLTGAVTTISAEDIADLAPSFDNALVGKAAGVNVSLTSGAPGSATAITIRGLSSINSDNNPLIVIDGTPIYGTGKGVNNVSFGNGSVSGGVIGGNSVSNGYTQQMEFERNPLAALSPNDIESIEILKDAFSTAIYGSRGAAGVILVTTKKGSKGKPQINVGYSFKLGKPIGTPTVLNANEFSSIYTKFNEAIDSKTKFPTDYNTEWLNEVLRSEIVQETRASITGGSSNNSYYISFSNFDQQGYILGQDLKRNSARANFDINPTEWIEFGTNTSITMIENAALNSQSVYRNAVMMSPNIPVYHPDGSYFFHTPFLNFDDNINTISGHLGNPVSTANENNSVKDTRVLSNFYVELKPLSWLSFKSQFGTDIYNTKSYNRNIATPRNPEGTATSSSDQNLKYVFNNVLTIQKLLDEHMINTIVGQSYETSEESNMRVTGTGFFDDSEKSINTATSKRVLNELTQKWAVVSYFTRLNYRYKDRYLAGFTYRIDGSSRFSKNERYRGFPSLSAGWILSEENFMTSSKNWLVELKLRASYGLTGLDGSFGGYYGNQGTWLRDNRTMSGNTLVYNGTPLLFNKQSVNPNLEWETTTSFDVGIDATLFHGKLDVTIDYFYKRTNNLLASDMVPLYMGWSIQQQNIGDMKNEGIELLVNGTIIRKQDWEWTGSFNISRIKDKLLRLNEAGHQMASAQGYEKKVFKVGESLSQFYLYDWVGVDPMTGNPLWRYGDGSISEQPPQASYDSDDPLANRFASGNSMPDFFGGFSNNIRYKNWDLNFAFSFAVGQKMLNGTKASLMTYTLTESNNLSTEMLDYWKIPSHQTDIPKLDNQTTVYTNPNYPTSGLNGYDVSRLNDRFLEDASYLRLRNITLAYTFKQNWLNRLFMERVRVYVQANNLLTLTGYSGVDPEVSAFGSSAVLGGYDEITMPQVKTIKFGVDLTF